jgi:predicted RNase H-like HicB family nuclease
VISLAIIRPAAAGGFDVRFPAFPDGMLVSDTRIEARDLAREVLGWHIAGLREEGLPVPEPGSFEALLADPAHAGGVAMLVALA